MTQAAARGEHGATGPATGLTSPARTHERSHIWTADETRFGIYIHWPFCAAKCPYCDFNSHVRHRAVDQDAFGQALVTELTTIAGWLDERPRVDSIFFGGGTPSLMEGRTVARLLEAAAGLFPLAPDCEITLEANPTSVEADRFAAYRAAGVNRVSLGVQALNDADLRALGRLHTRSEALHALEVAAGAFERVSYDLIYARPHQTADIWAEELRIALAIASGHLSLYQLTIEPGTPFHALHAAGKLAVPDADLASALYDLTQEMCAAAGLSAYEVSNHARPGQESRHNLVYWRSGDYLGVGPGAHGRITVDGERLATASLRQPERWRDMVLLGSTGAPTATQLIAAPLPRARAQDDRLTSRPTLGHGLDRCEHVPRAAHADEMVLMGLRLAEGLDLGALEAHTGMGVEPRTLTHLESLGLAIITDPSPGQRRGQGQRTGGAVGPMLVPTAQGRLVTNRLAIEVAQALLPRY